MRAVPGTHRFNITDRTTVKVAVLAVLAALLTMVATPAADAAGNGLTSKDCAGLGWKTLETPAGKPMPNVIVCDLYAVIGLPLRRTQTVAFTSTAPAPAPVGTTYRPAAKATSALPAVVTLDATSQGCTLVSGLVSFNAVGTCVLDANQAGSTVYGAAPMVKQSVRVAKAQQTISFSSTPPAQAVVGGTYGPAASSTSGLAVTITKDVSSTGCTLSAGIVSFTAAGTCVLDADQAGNANYLAATRVKQSIGVGKTAQTISFTSAPAGSTLVGGTYTPQATATSGLAAAISIDALSTGCTLAAGVVTYTGVGTCVLDANQAGNGTFSAAAQAQQSIQVLKAVQQVSFTSTAPAPATVGGTYVPAASSTSVLPAVISLDPSSTGCTLSSGTVTFTGAGTCVLDADQAGDGGTSAATQVTQSIDVVKKTQTVSFTSTAPAPGTVGGDYTPTAAADSNLDVVIGLGSASSGCTISDAGKVTFTGTGTCVLTADQPGDTTYSAAPRVVQDVTVLPATQLINFTTSAPSDATVGGMYAATATATSGLEVALSLDGSSTGCTLSSGVITFAAVGTCVLDANQAGSFAFTAAPQVQQTFTIAAATVDSSPTAVDDTATVGRFDSATSIDVLANDTDTDGGPKMIESVTQPANGTVLITGDGTGLTYAPSGSYCNSALAGDLAPDTFTYTLNGGSTATVRMTVTSAGTMPRLQSGVFLTERAGFLPAAPITELNSATANAISNSAKTTFDASNVVDPQTCTPGGLTYHWAIVYPGLQTEYTDSGITGYNSRTLTIAQYALINEPAGITITLSVTSPVSGLITRYTITAQVSDSILTQAIYNECQALPQGDPGCSIKNAGPVPTPPTVRDDALTVGKNLSATATTGTTLDVLANDTRGSDPMTITAVTQPANGTVTIAADGKSVSYLPTTNYCNHSLDANEADTAADAFTYTVNGASTANVSVTVAGVATMPSLLSGLFLTEKAGFLPAAPITELNSASANAISNSAKTTFDASNVVDPADCTPGGLTYHWAITYPLSPAQQYTDSGITGYNTRTLTIAPLALINEPVGITITLTVTSPVSGLITRYTITAQVVDSILTEDIYDQCQALPQGDPGCPIPVAGPIPAPPTA